MRLGMSAGQAGWLSRMGAAEVLVFARTRRFVSGGTNCDSQILFVFRRTYPILA